MELEFRFGPAKDGRKREPVGTSPAVDVLVIANVSGTRGSEPPALGDRPFVPVRGTLDQAFAASSPRLVLPGEGAASAPWDVRSLDDLHPDAVYGRAPLFAPFREGRFAASASASPSAPLASSSTSASPPSPRAPTSSTSGSDFDRLLGRAAQTEPRTAVASTLDRLLAEIVTPHVVPAPDPAARAREGAAAQVAAALLREVLQLPDWKRLEASWRGLDFLVRRAGEDDVRFHLIDATAAELAADAQDDVTRSGLHRLLVSRGAPAGGRFSLVVVDAFVEGDAAGAALAAHLARAGAAAGTPIVAGAAPSLVGVTAPIDRTDPRDLAVPAADDAWRALRTSSEAAFLGLGWPRLLLRAPYGAKTDAIESIPFEELSGAHAPERLLWGNAAFACALPFIAEARARLAGEEAPDDQRDIDDLPLVVFDDAGERQMQACAEGFVSERLAAAVLDAGVMPLCSERHRNAVRVLRVQSVAEPSKTLG